MSPLLLALLAAAAIVQPPPADPLMLETAIAKVFEHVGDVVMNRTFVAFASPYSSVKAWLIDAQRTMMRAIQSRAIELKRQGKTADETAQAVQSEFQGNYPDWAAPARVGVIAKTAYREAP